MPILLLGFGSSARRGATGWTDRARVNRTLAICRPDIVVDGASPSDKPDHGAHMLGVCLQGREGVPPCPVVVYRDNGIEPFDIGTALAQLRRLYAVTRDPALVGPGKALASLCECGSPSPEEVADGLTYAADGSRWAPWIEAVRASLRGG